MNDYVNRQKILAVCLRDGGVGLGNCGVWDKKLGDFGVTTHDYRCIQWSGDFFLKKGLHIPKTIDRFAQ